MSGRSKEKRRSTSLIRAFTQFSVFLFFQFFFFWLHVFSLSTGGGTDVPERRVTLPSRRGREEGELSSYGKFLRTENKNKTTFAIPGSTRTHLEESHITTRLVRHSTRNGDYIEVAKAQERRKERRPIRLTAHKSATPKNTA